MEINQNNGKDFTVLNISLKIPEKLKPVIESIGRITGREVDDLCSLLIIDQLKYFKEDQGAILDYMKGYETFIRNMCEGDMSDIILIKLSEILPKIKKKKRNLKY